LYIFITYLFSSALINKLNGKQDKGQSLFNVHLKELKRLLGFQGRYPYDLADMSQVHMTASRSGVGAMWQAFKLDNTNSAKLGL
jgi:hypothetical protein